MRVRIKVCLPLLLALLLLGCVTQPGKLTATPNLTATHEPVTTETAVSHQPLELQFGVKYRVEVLRVIDGDTIDVEMPDGSVERVRMLGVDTPEKTAEKNRPYEYDSITNTTYLAEWGIKAKEFTKSMLDGKYAYIEFDEKAGFRGYYGRLLAYIYLENGTDFTAELVKRGYARVYTEGNFEKENYYIQLENGARQEGRGLWAYGQTGTGTETETETGTGIGTGTTGQNQFNGTVTIEYVHYDAAGDDRYNLNDEYAVIENAGTATVNLKDWTLKDESGKTYPFPDVVLTPGQQITVHTGSGNNNGTDLFWGSGRPIWNNDHDTAYLFNSNGELVDKYYW